MYFRLTACALMGIWLAAASALAQNNPIRGPEPNGAYGPDQPVQPQVPRLQQRPAPPPAARQPAPQQPQQPPPPFILTPQEEAQVDRVLNIWEERNKNIKTFDCGFKRWTYDLVFAKPNEPLKPKFIEVGVIRYAAPDRGLFRIDKEERDGKEVAIDDARAEHWLCDGTAVYQYLPARKRVEEHKLPAELRGKAIANSPLPFLFGAEAQKLKQRYFIRIVTPRDVAQDQIWLEAHPRFQQDAANFRRATFVITVKDMSPFALEIVQPNGKDYITYRFDDIVVNDRLRIFQGNPFRPFTPWGWTMVPDQLPSAEARRPPSEGRR
jgi:TIGR03009 family protein